jgi:hypothetical protein
MVLLYRFMTGFWDAAGAASRLTLRTEMREGSDLLGKKESLEPRRCFGVEGIFQTVTPVPCVHKGKGQQTQ